MTKALVTLLILALIALSFVMAKPDSVDWMSHGAGWIVNDHETQMRMNDD